jgi:uncharacterized membrane protein YfcA
MWPDLSLPTLILVWLGGFLGGLASGAAGFAYGVVASAIWLHVISPLHTALLVVAGGLIMQFGLTWTLRRAVDMRRLGPFLLAGLAGVPIGVVLVVKTDPGAVKLALAALMVAYGAYALLGSRLPYVANAGVAADAAVGFLGGLLGGLAGLSGILPAIWTQLRGWPKDTARAVYQPYIVAMHLATLALLGIVAIDREGLALFAAVLPSVLLGAWVGWLIYGRLDERRFRQLLAVLLILSGGLLIV